MTLSLLFFHGIAGRVVSVLAIVWVFVITRVVIRVIQSGIIDNALILLAI